MIPKVEIRLFALKKVIRKNACTVDVHKCITEFNCGLSPNSRQIINNMAANVNEIQFLCTHLPIFLPVALFSCLRLHIYYIYALFLSIFCHFRTIGSLGSLIEYEKTQKSKWMVVSYGLGIAGNTARCFGGSHGKLPGANRVSIDWCSSPFTAMKQ